jgi:hypothetical protein
MTGRLCRHHPDVDAERMWGCPDCLCELRALVAELVEAVGGCNDESCHDPICADRNDLIARARAAIAGAEP